MKLRSPKLYQLQKSYHPGIILEIVLVRAELDFVLVVEEVAIELVIVSLHQAHRFPQPLELALKIDEIKRKSRKEERGRSHKDGQHHLRGRATADFDDQ